VAAVEAGRADLAIQVPFREMARLAKIPGLVATTTPFAEIVMLVTPSYVPAMQDENVRLAMQLSIDKAALSKAFYNGAATPLSVLATPGTDSYVKGYTFPYDKARAIALLQKSGFSPEHPWCSHSSSPTALSPMISTSPAPLPPCGNPSAYRPIFRKCRWRNTLI
jgi:peptide/nickel transport system substrate-binding protein